MLYLFKKNRAYLIATFLFIFYPMVLLLVIIMFLDPSEKTFALDKLLHFSTFSIITYLIFFALSYQDKILFLKIHRTAITILFALSIGTSIEIIQLYMPNRSTSIYDIIANLCGVLFTILIIKHSPRSIKKLKRYGIWISLSKIMEDYRTTSDVLIVRNQNPSNRIMNLSWLPHNRQSRVILLFWR